MEWLSCKLVRVQLGRWMVRLNQMWVGGQFRYCKIGWLGKLARLVQVRLYKCIGYVNLDWIKGQVDEQVDR